MIIDSISRLALYEGLIPNAAEIAAAFAAQTPERAPYEVREKSYSLKEDATRRFEVHGHTIDLMMARDGAETIQICPAQCLIPAEALPNGADGRKLDGAPQGSAVVLEAGCFCAGEAHMVAGRIDGAEGSIAKWVVKVPCPEAFTVQL